MSLFDGFAAPAPQRLDPNNPQTVLTPDAVKRRQALADALAKEASDASPVRSGWQAAARVAQGLLGGYYSGQADQAEQAGAAQSAKTQAAVLAAALGNDNSATPAAPGAAVASDDSAAPAAAGVAAPGSPAVLSAIQTAANENGIPLPVAHAMATQESRLNPNAPTGGLFQITQGTAADPGYGLAPFDMSKVNDPLANARFGLKYLAARNPGIDWNDPAQLTKALNSYNGGGDPNYVANVLRHYDPKGVAALYGAGGPQVASAPLAAPAPVASPSAAPAPLPPIQTDGFSPPALGATMPPALATAAPAAAGGGWSPPGEIAPAVAAQQAAQRAALAASLRAPGAWTPPAEIGGVAAAQAASPAPGPQAFAGAGVGALPPSMTAPPQAPPVAVAAAPAPVIAQGDEGDDAPTNPVPVGAGLNIPASAGVPVPGATSQPVAVPAVAPAAPAPNAPALAAALRSPKDRAQIASLVGAMSDPWADDGTKQVAATLLAARLKGATTGAIVKDPTTGQFGQYDSTGKFTTIANADKETQTAEQKNFEYSLTHPDFTKYQQTHGAEASKAHVVNGALVDNQGHVLYQSPASLVTPRAVDENGAPIYSQSEKTLGEMLRQGLPVPPGLSRTKEGAALIRGAVDYSSAVGNQDPVLEAHQRGQNRANWVGENSEQRALGPAVANNALYGNAAASTIDTALRASAEVPRGQWRPWNQVMQMGQTALSDPKLAAFATATNTLINDYAKATTPVGVPTDSQRSHAESMLGTAQSPEVYDAVARMMHKEIANTHRAIQDTKTNLQGGVVGELPPLQTPPPGGATPAAPVAAPAPAGPAHYNFDAKGNLIQ
jgi:hypothetical protein